MKNERIKLLAIMFALVVSVSGEATNNLTGANLQRLNLFNGVQPQEDTSDIEGSDAGSVPMTYLTLGSVSSTGEVADNLVETVLANGQNLQDAGNPQDPDNLPDGGGPNTQAAQNPTRPARFGGA